MSTEQDAADVERKRDMIARLYERANALLDKLADPEFRTLVKEGRGAEAEQVLGFVPTEDERNIAQAVNGFLLSAERLAQSLPPADGLDAARSMIGRLMTSLGLNDTPAPVDDDDQVPAD